MSVETLFPTFTWISCYVCNMLVSFRKDKRENTDCRSAPLDHNSLYQFQLTGGTTWRDRNNIRDLHTHYYASANCSNDLLLCPNLSPPHLLLVIIPDQVCALRWSLSHWSSGETTTTDNGWQEVRCYQLQRMWIVLFFLQYVHPVVILWKSDF